MNKSKPNIFCFRLSDPDAARFRDNVAMSNLNQQNYIERCVLDKRIVSIDRKRRASLFMGWLNSYIINQKSVCLSNTMAIKPLERNIRSYPGGYNPPG